HHGVVRHRRHKHKTLKNNKLYHKSDCPPGVLGKAPFVLHLSEICRLTPVDGNKKAWRVRVRTIFGAQCHLPASSVPPCSRRLATRWHGVQYQSAWSWLRAPKQSPGAIPRGSTGGTVRCRF